MIWNCSVSAKVNCRSSTTSTPNCSIASKPKRRKLSAIWAFLSIQNSFGSTRFPPLPFPRTKKLGSHRANSVSRSRLPFSVRTSSASSIEVMEVPPRGPYHRLINNGGTALWLLLKPIPPPPWSALRRDGFQLTAGVLRDKTGQPVEFSIITNGGNKTRERMAAMIQQDLKPLGIRVTVTTLDFPSLIERITSTFNYEACMLGQISTDVDPNGQSHVWNSSSESHQWNPNQKTPATDWEAEIDRLMAIQASTPDQGKRKAAFDQVQKIVAEQAPFIYLANRHNLIAVSSRPRQLRSRNAVASDSLERRSSLPASMNSLLATDVSVDYRTKPGVLRNFQLEIGAGEIVGLAGQSGSGKSTFALTILGLLDRKNAQVTGRVDFAGRNLVECKEPDFRRIRGREISLVPQSPLASLNPCLRLSTQFKEAWSAHRPDSKSRWT